MRKGRWAGLLLVLVAAMPGFAVAQPIELRLTLQVPITNHLGVNLMQFKDEVEKRTKTAITIEIFDKGQLYIDERVVDAVAAGEIEMGVAGLSQFSYRTAAVDVIQMPFLFNFEALVRAATGSGSQLRRLIDSAILESTGVRVLWWQSYGSTVFFSKGRDALAPSRIRDQRVRVFSETMAEFAKECGGIPTVLSSSKMYDAMKSGALDMIMTGVSGVDTRELWKVADTDHANGARRARVRRHCQRKDSGSRWPRVTEPSSWRQRAMRRLCCAIRSPSSRRAPTTSRATRA